MTDRQRASRLEILGAWLHVWTVPRDVDVPPVPWRKVMIAAALVVVACVVVALTVAPAIDDAKRRGAAEDRRAEEERRATRHARIRAEQRPRRGVVPAWATRRGALAAVAQEVGKDARARFGADGRAADCEPVPGAEAAASRVLFDCLAPVREIRGAGEQEGAGGTLAIPYRAAIDFESRRYAFCKANPRAGELAVPDPEDIVELPAACRGRS